MALLKATSGYRGQFEHSSAVVALVFMSVGRWNCFRRCSMSFSEHVETLNYATIDKEGTMRIGSSATMVVAPRGGCRAAVTWSGSTGLASITCEVEAEDSGRNDDTEEP